MAQPLREGGQKWITVGGRNVIRCHAESKKAKANGGTWPETQCKNPAKPGYTVCRFHGMGALSTGGRPITHGGYSKRLPSALVVAYEASQNDPQLLSLRNEIALMEVRIGELVGKLGQEGIADTAVEEIKKGLALIRSGSRDDGIRMIEEAIVPIEQEQRVWDDVLKFIEEKRRLATSEISVLTQYGAVLTMQQFATIITRLLGLLEKYLSPDGLIAVASEIRSWVDSPSREDLVRIRNFAGEDVVDGELVE